MNLRRTVVFATLLLCQGLILGPVVEEPFGHLATAWAESRSETASSSPSLQGKLAELKAETGKLPAGPRRARFQWVRHRLSRLAENKEEAEELRSIVENSLVALRAGKDASDAVPWLDEEKTEGSQMLDNGRIGLGFVATERGISLESLFDFNAERELLSGTSKPFWSLLLTASSGEKLDLNSAKGWDKFRLKKSTQKAGGERAIEMKWAKEHDGSEQLRATCVVSLLGEKSSWRMEVDNLSKTWSIRNIVFPQISLGRIGDSEEDDFLVVPHGSGGLRPAPLKTRAEFSGRYPGGWCSMQFFSHYDGDCGLYVGIHDPVASTKDFKVDSPSGSSIDISIGWPAPDTGVAGNDWWCPGDAILQVFRGDWFDAAQVYKRWVADGAKWWPEKEGWGRSDTPRWFQDIAVWAMTGGGPDQVVEPVKKFAEYMGVPTAVHWYNWHVVPFDNDYPHYFPYKKGFPEGVKALQEANVRVMPYINGRLWDTDLDDFKNNAIRFCTKDEKGQPYIEVYGSGEKLCPMCPTTELWQKTVQDTVLRLFSPEVDVDAIYVDQVAAATPCLCFDKTHGHPLAGGHWWNTQGYWPMLVPLQMRMARLHPDKILTTECNAEPYVHVFDGYLTWHFQYENQIPLFAAVYGGKIQLFSRAYQGDSWKGLAMRMKTGQALVFGEQLGWITPQVISDAESASFLRRMARLRYALRDYLARGTMARPPVLDGELPTVTADWQWGGKRLVILPAILSAAWQAKDGKVALIFVNVSDESQQARLDFNAEQYGLSTASFLNVTSRTESGSGETARENKRFERAIKLEPRDALALEVSPGS